MSTTKTATVKTEKTETTKSTKTPAKTTATAKAKPAKTAEKKERKSRKGITRTFAAEVTATVNPIMDAVNSFINDPNTSEDALKMIRLELRKSVKASRATIRSRKSNA